MPCVLIIFRGCNLLSTRKLLSVHCFKIVQNRPVGFCFYFFCSTLCLKNSYHFPFKKVGDPAEALEYFS